MAQPTTRRECRSITVARYSQPSSVHKYVERLRTLGHRWNHKRIYRVYCGLGLNQPRRTRRKLPEREREPLFVPQQRDQVWSADFMSDVLYYGTRFRTLVFGKCGRSPAAGSMSTTTCGHTMRWAGCRRVFMRTGRPMLLAKYESGLKPVAIAA
jgi:putative transposase